MSELKKTDHITQESILRSRLQKGERGIPKIPDSPDTRHAQAQPPSPEHLFTELLTCQGEPECRSSASTVEICASLRTATMKEAARMICPDCALWGDPETTARGFLHSRDGIWYRCLAASLWAEVHRRPAEQPAPPAEKLPAILNSEHPHWAEQPAPPRPPVSIREMREVLQLVRKEWAHKAPEDCYATGPSTGNPVSDYVSCPGCAVQARIDAILAGAEQPSAPPQPARKRTRSHADWEQEALADPVIAKGYAEARAAEPSVEAPRHLSADNVLMLLDTFVLGKWEEWNKRGGNETIAFKVVHEEIARHRAALSKEQQNG